MRLPVCRSSLFAACYRPCHGDCSRRARAHARRTCRPRGLRPDRRSDAADLRARGTAVCRRRAGPSVRAAHPQFIRRRALLAVTSVDGVNVISGETAARAAERLCARRLGLGAASKAGARAWTRSPPSTSRASPTPMRRAPDVRTMSVSSASRCFANVSRATRPAADRGGKIARLRLGRTRSERPGSRGRRAADATPVARASGAARRSSARSRSSRSLARAVRGLPARLVDAGRNDRHLLRLAQEPGRARRAAAAAPLVRGSPPESVPEWLCAGPVDDLSYSGSAAPPPILRQVLLIDLLDVEASPGARAWSSALPASGGGSSLIQRSGLTRATTNVAQVRTDQAAILQLRDDLA